MEPTEEAILSFVSFTSTTRDQATAFLKANNLDSQKAINAYFEDPTGPPPKATKSYNQGSSWDFHQQDNAPPLPATAPPTRPPSRIDKSDADQNTGKLITGADASKEGSQGLSLAEREEKELQRAVAMSLGSDMGQQQTGVTTSSQPPQFTKATQDHYEENAWAMTLLNAEEVVLSPDPKDRKRAEGEPAFIRPNPEDLYLGGILTIFHNIPLAREALLLRQKRLVNYGHEAEWWNGHAINLPKIVTVNDDKDTDSDWDDIIHETQRLMSFMDSTKRAFGSSDSLAKIKSMSPMSADSEDTITRFMEAWNAAAMKADPGNPLTTIFTSKAYKYEPADDPAHEPTHDSKELFTFEPAVENPHGDTLYDVLDSALWNDSPGQELDDTWLEYVADVLVIKLDASQKPNPVEVEVPLVFYPDRYLSGCREIARDFRRKGLEIQGEILKLEQLMNGYAFPQKSWNTISAREILDKAAQAIKPAAPEQMSDSEPGSDVASAETKTSEELKAIVNKIDVRLKELEQRKQNTLESLREISKTLTEPSESPHEPPLYRYTLRGVCTKPHVTYVLSDPNKTTGDLMDMDGEPHDNYQWWRVSFSAEDEKARQAETSHAQDHNATADSGDVVGYTTQKVSEMEVLRAAREEWSSVLLVYASEKAVNAPVNPAPPALQSFVNKDNNVFADELEHTSTIVPSDQGHSWPSTDEAETKHQEMPPTFSKNAQVNVFDYEVSNFDDEKPRQEMQEIGGTGLLDNGTANKAAMNESSNVDSQWNPASEDTNAHIEHVK